MTNSGTSPVSYSEGREVPRSPSFESSQQIPKPVARTLSRDISIESGQPGVISDASQNIITRLRLDVAELQTSHPLHIPFDDAYLDRFVKARKGRYEEVLLMVRNHIAWYIEFGVAQIADFNFGELEQFRTVYPHGYHGVDKFGRPVYIERYSKMNADFLHQITTLERISKYWVQGYERLLYERFPSCGPKITQSCVILDLAGIKLSMFNSRAREFLRTVSKISSDNYPETLGCMFIVNVPSFFSILYSVAKPLIPPETKKKIHVVNAKHVKEELLKFIDADQLPKFLGGYCVCDERSTAEDHGCLSSDRGPWSKPHLQPHHKESVEEFVSCPDANEFEESRSFVTLDSHFVSPATSIRRPVKTRWRFFTCCSNHDEM